MKILAIEDDSNTCVLLKRLLNEADIKWTDFRCIATLQAARHELEIFEPDFIFLDLKLPDSPDGKDAVKQILFFNKIAPTVVLTGMAENFFVQCMLAGAMDCLDKKLYIIPSNMAFLAHVIARAKLTWKKS